MPVVGTCPTHGVTTMPCVKCAEMVILPHDSVAENTQALYEVSKNLQVLIQILSKVFGSVNQDDEWDSPCTPLFGRN